MGKTITANSFGGKYDMKKLYKQFNDLNLDINIEPMEVSTVEKERVKRNVMMVKKKRHFIKNFIVAATFLLRSV